MTWDRIRGTLQWAVVLLLVGVIAAGGLAARWWAAKDALLADAIHRHLSQELPDCDVEFDAVRLVDSSHVELTHLTVRSQKSNSELVRIPRIAIEFDSALLRDYRRIVVREIVAQSPEVKLIRDQDNKWNWAGCRLRQKPGGMSPNWVVKNGTLLLGFQSTIDGPIRVIACQGIQAALNPESRRRYQLDCSGVAEEIGPMRLTGLIDGQSGEWQVQGSAGEIRFGDPLLELAGRIAPQVNAQLAKLRESSQTLMAKTMGPPIRTATSDGATPVKNAAETVTTESLLRADVAVEFRCSKAGPQSPLDYSVHGLIQNGHLSEMLLRIPLFDLAGEFQLTPNLIQIQNLRAANGSSTLNINGSAERKDGEWSKEFSVRVTELQLDERIREFLPDAFRRQYDLLQPSGTFDLDVDLAYPSGDRPPVTLRKFSAHNCRVICDYFRYPVDQVNGEIVQHGSKFEIQMRGEAAGNPVNLVGTISPGDPDENLHLSLKTGGVRIDSAFRSALQRPEQDCIRKALDGLRLDGVADEVQVEILRGERTAGRVIVRLTGQLLNGAMNYTAFPYQITNLTGRVTYDPLVRDAWMFEDLQGEHEAVRLTGRGIFDLKTPPGILALNISCLQVPLDHELRKASETACPDLKVVWRDFGIQGLMDVDRIGIHWNPGSSPQVVLDGIRWTHGRFCPVAFPYEWTNVTAALQWNGSRLKIHSFQGDHNATYLNVNGSRADADAYILVAPSPDVAWQVHLADLKTVQLNPDEEFLRALPITLSDALKAVELRKPVDLQMGLDLKGWNTENQISSDPLITASWQGLATFRNNVASAGIPLTDLNGIVRVLSGIWDGRNVAMEGYVKLDTLRTLDLPFRNVEGPFLLKDSRLTFGSPQLTPNLPSYSELNPYRQSQIKGYLYGGQMGLDVDVSLANTSNAIPYQLELKAFDVDLGKWAVDWKMDSQRLKGMVNGVLQASGRGNSAMATIGQGWVQITPAELYELPVFAQMFSLLSFRPSKPGEAAFNYAYGDFSIHEGLFDFSKIELVGEMLRLRGRGTVGYAGPRAEVLDMDFYAMMLNRTPVIGPLVNAMGDRWLRVNISGTVSNPIARPQPTIPLLNEAFDEFMRASETGQIRRVPPRILRPTKALSP